VNRVFGIILAFSLLFSYSREASAAPRITVRSGEHKTFTRLVFQFNTGVRWSLRKIGNEYILGFAPKPLPIDLSSIFRYIPKSRLVSIKQTDNNPGKLAFTVANGQVADAFEIGVGKLVVDVKNAPQKNRANMARSTVIHSRSPIPSSVDQPTSQSTLSRAKVAVRDPLSITFASTNPRPKPISIQDLPAQIKRSQSEIPSLPLLTDSEVLAARKKLAQQIGRAMSQGILTPSHMQHAPKGGSTPDPPVEKTTAPINRVRRRLDREQQHKLTLAASKMEQLNIVAKSAFDKDARLGTSRENKTVNNRNCVQSTFFDLPEWFGNDPPTQTIAHFRSKLLGEFDRVNVSALRKLVKWYVANGFGVEARAFLDNFSDKFPHGELLKSLAELIETGKVPDGNILEEQAVCPGRGRLWGVLAQQGAHHSKTPLKIADFSKQIGQLPIALRQRVGSILISRFLALGDIKSALKTATLVERAVGATDADFLFQRARLNLATGNISAARKRFVRIAEGHGPNSSRAFLVLLENPSLGQKPISNNLLIDAEFAAFKIRSTKLGAQLLERVILEVTKQKDQTKAFTILMHENEISPLGRKQISRIVAGIFSSFDIDKLRRADFLTLFFRYRNLLSPVSEMDNTRRHIAKALLKVGLPTVALDELRPVLSRIRESDPILLGKIYLRLDQPLVVVKMLAGRSSTEAKLIRREALERIGDIRSAASIDIGSKRTQATQDMAWQASRWDIVKLSSLVSRRGIAARTLSAGDGPRMGPKTSSISKKSVGLNRQPTLNSYMTVLKRGIRTRTSVSNLLTEHPNPRVRTY